MTAKPATAAAVLDAVLERITYANEETGYTIAKVATARGGGDLLTVVGPLLGAQPGESLRLTGRWSSHPRYGRQFEVFSYTTVLQAMFVSLLTDSPFPRLMAAFIDAAERDPTLKGLHRELTSRRRQPMLQILAEAVERREIAADADLELVVDLLTGPFFYRRFIAHQPIPPDMTMRVVDRILGSLRPVG